MSDEGEVKTIEIEDAPEPEAKEPVTLESLADSGLEKAEIEMAEKQGLVTKESEDEDKPRQKGGEVNGKEEKGEEESKSKENGVLKKGSDLEDRFRVIADGRPAEKVISEIAEKGDLTKDQEAVLLASLTQNGKNLYWAQKYERRQKQKVAGERDALAKKTQEYEEKIKELEREVSERRKTKDTDEDEDPLKLHGDDKKDEETDPKKKPLTEADLDRREKERKDKEEADEAARLERASVVKEALEDQRVEAESRYEDFTDVLQLTGEIIDAANSGKLAALYPNPRERSRVERDVTMLLRAFANADKFEPGEYNAADMTYELGQKHPNFGKPTKKPAANGSKNGETDADGNPEAARRAIQNANRRGSSASLGGGGSRREISFDELTEDQAARLSDAEWNKLPQATRDRLLGK